MTIVVRSSYFVGLLVLCLAMAFGFRSTSAYAAERQLRLNEIQVIGSHNSYKLAMAPERFAELQASRPELAKSLEYWHVPLNEQLDLGLRKLELDVFYDPDGSLFGRNETASASRSASSFPVLHVQTLDDRSSCVNLLTCLTVIRRWSDAHPRHVPVIISINAKDTVYDRPGYIQPRPYVADAWLALDAEFGAVLGDKLITPAEVFESGTRTWPTLADSRGRFLAVLDEGGEKRRVYAGIWRERLLFANLPAGEAGAAVMIVNDPIRDFERIKNLVREGYLVRTRADADTAEARSGSTERRDRAFASGAQMISTDYYGQAKHFGTTYQVVLPGKRAVRCNPVLIAEHCEIEE
ncbi:MAG: Ca2+-dependent phosphoinositide-specific phospholipase C [Gammaproteobacteria bacterium]|nr:Ca2+-dependent phosphoinositide-specific phospholipase C [Gammaproteobacteria bacterium]